MRRFLARLGALFGRGAVSRGLGGSNGNPVVLPAGEVCVCAEDVVLARVDVAEVELVSLCVRDIALARIDVTELC